MKFEEIAAHVELSDQAKAFVESELGQCVLGMAKQEIDGLKNDLAETDPHNVSKVMQLQERIRACGLFNQWLVELIFKGDQALAAFQQEERTD